jgi:uncharacterized membrane protein
MQRVARAGAIPDKARWNAADAAGYAQRVEVRMEDLFRTIASYVALMLESIVVVTVAVGALEAIYRMFAGLLTKGEGNWDRRAIWLRFAGWILLGLEFALGADIIRTAIAPTWDDIGKLGAIAAIRTFLGYFLGRDLETAEEAELPPAGPAQ